MKTSARLSLLAAAMAVGGLFAAPAQALTATAQPALVNPGHVAMTRPANASAFCSTSAPARVTGAIAPASVNGVTQMI